MDRNVTIEELRLKVSGFRDNRNWLKYHTPKNLAMSITIESAELLEHFQWKTDAEVSRQLEDEHKISGVADELADIIIYCLAFSDVLRIDLVDAITRKIQKNAKKYPIALASPRFKP